jgi:hypothetical protein
MLRKCHELWKQKQARVHVFGLARWTLFEAYREFGVTSFDGAYHRRAWISGTNNYELEDRAYTAIRIPLSHRLEAGKRTAREELVFGKLRLYYEAKASVAAFLKTLHSYDPRRVEMFAKQYERTLNDRPWEKCDCAICRSIGINVCVFRTSERNMRRGFHNLWNFYKRFKEFYGEDAEKSGVTGASLRKP